MPLTDMKIRALKPEPKVRRYADGGNMYLQVMPYGSKLWKMAYSFGGKQKTLSFGKYPVTTLARTRELREEAKALLQAGIDPIEQAREVEAVRQAEYGNLFADIAAELLDKNFQEGLAEVNRFKKRWLIGIANADLGHMPKGICQILLVQREGASDCHGLVAGRHRVGGRGFGRNT